MRWGDKGEAWSTTGHNDEAEGFAQQQALTWADQSRLFMPALLQPVMRTQHASTLPLPPPTLLICCTSSLVGAMMRPMGPSPWARGRWSLACLRGGDHGARER